MRQVRVSERKKAKGLCDGQMKWRREGRKVEAEQEQITSKLCMNSGFKVALDKTAIFSVQLNSNKC